MIKEIGGILTTVLGSVLVFWLTQPLYDRWFKATEKPIPAPNDTLRHEPAALPTPNKSKQLLNGIYRGSMSLVAVSDDKVSPDAINKSHSDLELYSDDSGNLSGKLRLNHLMGGPYSSETWNIVEGSVKGSSFHFKVFYSFEITTTLVNGTIMGDKIGGTTEWAGPLYDKMLAKRPRSYPLPPVGYFEMLK